MVLVSDASYRASLIDFESKIPTSTFVFSQNHVEHNYFLGADSSLIAISGGVFDVDENVFMHNGYASFIELQKHPDSVDA